MRRPPRKLDDEIAPGDFVPPPFVVDSPAIGDARDRAEHVFQSTACGSPLTSASTATGAGRFSCRRLGLSICDFRCGIGDVI